MRALLAHLESRLAPSPLLLAARAASTRRARPARSPPRGPTRAERGGELDDDASAPSPREEEHGALSLKFELECERAWHEHDVAALRAALARASAELADATRAHEDALTREKSFHVAVEAELAASYRETYVENHEGFRVAVNELRDYVDAVDARTRRRGEDDRAALEEARAALAEANATCEALRDEKEREKKAALLLSTPDDEQTYLARRALLDALVRARDGDVAGARDEVESAVSIARALDFRVRFMEEDASSEEERETDDELEPLRTARFVFAGGGKDASTGEPAPFWVKVDATLEGEPSDARVVASRGGGGGAAGVSRATMRWEALDDDAPCPTTTPYLTSGVLVVSPGDDASGWLPPGEWKTLVNASPSDFTVAPTEVPRDAWKIAPAVASSKDDEVEVDVKVAVAADVKVATDVDARSPPSTLRTALTLPSDLRPVSIEFAAVRGLRDDDPFMAAAIRFLKRGEIDEDDDVFSRLSPEVGIGEISWVAPPMREPGEPETDPEARGDGAIAEAAAEEVGGGVKNPR